MSTALSLSGGGAKGDFQLGAVAFLKRVRELKPDIIVGSSVGSINGIKLAERDGTGPSGTANGLDGLEHIWFDLLDCNADMYRPTPTFVAALDLLEGDLEEIVTSGLITSPLGVHFNLIFALNLSGVKDIIERLLKQNSIYTLEPIRQLLQGNRPHLDLVSVRESSTYYMACMVSLNSGKVRYVDKFGQLFDRGDLKVPIASGVPLGSAVLASSAIPVAFEPQLIAGEYYVDGGVREVVPVEACIGLGATRVISILAGGELPYIETAKLTPHPPDDKYPPPYEEQRKLLIAIAMRGIEACVDEVMRDDLRVAAAAGQDLYFVQPEIEIHDTLTINAGLIRFSYDYGWMSAFDVVDSRIRSPYRRQALRLLALRLVEQRLQKRDKESMGVSNRTSLEIATLAWQQQGGDALMDTSSFDAEFQLAIDVTRQAAANVSAIVNARRLIGGADSMPPTIDQAWQSSTFRSRRSIDHKWKPAPAENALGDYDFWKGPLPPADRYAADHRALWHEPAGAGSGPVAMTRFGRWGQVHQMLPQDDGARLAHFIREENGNWLNPGYAAFIINDATAAGGFGKILGSALVHGVSGDHPGHLDTVTRVGTDAGGHLFAATASGAYSWTFNGMLISGGVPIDGVTGDPAMIISSSGNYELFVPRGSELYHYWRPLDSNPTVWEEAGSILNVDSDGVDPNQGIAARTLVSAMTFEDVWRATATDDSFSIGVAQSGIFCVIAVTRSTFGHSLTYAERSGDGAWTTAAVHTADGAIGAVSGRPGFMQSTFGNLELVVPHGPFIKHYWKPRTQLHWNAGAVLGRAERVLYSDMHIGNAVSRKRIGTTTGSFVAADLVQTGYGLPGNYFVVAKAHYTGSLARNEVRQYWFDTQARQWQAVRNAMNASGAPLEP